MHKFIISFIVLIFISNIGLSLFWNGDERLFIKIIAIIDLIYLLCFPIIIALYKLDKKKNPEVYKKVNIYYAKTKIENDFKKVQNNPSTGISKIKNNFFYKLFVFTSIIIIIFGLYEIFQYFQLKDIKLLKEGLKIVFWPSALIISILKAKPLKKQK